ncbi:MAG TPA: phosphatase PAP2 family protein [Blastocatellia bacterium]|nr:phosphatase PAP2 family protein [Blastocatellia bacterium]
MKRVVGITHSPSKFRHILLLGFLFCALTQQSARSQDTAAQSRDIVGICGYIPCLRPEAQIEPKAVKWKPWLLDDARQVQPPGPPARSISEQEIRVLKQLSFHRDAGALDLISYWDAGSPSLRWNEHAVDQVIRNNLIGPPAARVMASLHVAIYDAMIAAWHSKYLHRRPRPSDFNRTLTTVIPNPRSPSYPSEHAVAAGAASAVLAYFFPQQTAFFYAKAEEAGKSRLLAGVHYPSDVKDGLELGRAVAQLVIARAQTDGSDVVFTGSIPQGACNWKGTNPVLPLAGTWKTWALTSGSQFRPGPPPACDSTEMATELAEVKNFPRSIPAAGASFDTTRLAFFWQGVSPAIKPWNDLTTQKISEYRLDTNPPRAARVYALVSIAFYDSLIACWDAKYAYWAIRPNQLDPTITTLFPNLNHPSYPSGHTSLSGGQAEVLAYLFPRDAEFIRSFVVESSNSRIWAGIHYRSDLDAGLALTKQVAELIIERAKNDGSQ